MITGPNQPIETLKGVGPSLQGKLARLGILRTTDLLLHLPMRYQDRTRLVPLREVRAQTECLVVGRVVESKITYGRRRSWLVTIADDSGFLGLRFFYFSRQQQASLSAGMFVRAFGEARMRAGGLEMTHPEYRGYHSLPPETERELTPVYHTTKGLGQARIRSLTLQLQAMKWPENSGTPYSTLLFLHAPPADTSLQEIAVAREKIALDELVAYYLIMRHRQSDRAHQRTIPLPQAQQLGRVLLQSLGFKLTGAQRRVVTEVLEDLARTQPMLRLLQGDVGSGKTVVAAFAAIRAAEHGMQTALMAPTEILAEQHYLTFSNWLEPLGINVILLTGRQTVKVRRQCQAAIAEGKALVAVGTHALFQNSVVFKNLALTIVDEQHRFGVHQRMALKNKGRAAHQLVMTATPIPRTLTMALYADMDISLIDELPKGRQPIETRTVPESRREEVVRRVGEVLATGQQAYWVCPLIEDSEQLEAAAAESTEQLLRKSLPQIRVGLLHGRMPSAEKGQTMNDFKDGRIQLLVATTVVEVGVDVTNATLMVIENPERMGLSQLHQLRGRIGRGRESSHCILLYKSPLSETARTRLQTIRKSCDGFFIAEQDLKLRGPGELLGTRQTGEQQFRVADLRSHAHLMPQVIATGDRLLKEDPGAVKRLLEAWAPADTGHISV